MFKNIKRVKMKSLSYVGGLGLALVLSMGLIGCSGGDDSASSDNGNNSVALVESGTSETYSDLEKPYDIKGSYGIYYDTKGCWMPGLVNNHFEVYENGLISTSWDWNGATYSSICYVEDVFEHIDLKNTTDVNASYVNSYTLYDSNTKVFYDTDYISSSDYRLIEIINDGMNAILEKSDTSRTTIQIKDAYTKIDPSVIKITKYEPTVSYYLGDGNDLMETGYDMRDSHYSLKPYNLAGYLYNYDDSGCNFSFGAYYEIYNDGLIIATEDDGTTSSCVVTKFFEHVKLSNSTDVNASYVNNYTFYDNNTKVFYNTTYVSSSSSSLVEVINDGMNGIVNNGDGSLVRVQITNAYKQISM